MKRALFVLLALGLSSVARAEGVDAAKLWTENKCNSCHGDAGKADTKQGKAKKIADMTTAEFQKKVTDDQMKKSITEGVERTDDGVEHKMKKFNKLKTEEVDALIKLVRSWAPKA